MCGDSSVNITFLSFFGGVPELQVDAANLDGAVEVIGNGDLRCRRGDNSQITVLSCVLEIRRWLKLRQQRMLRMNARGTGFVIWQTALAAAFQVTFTSV